MSGTSPPLPALTTKGLRSDGAPLQAKGGCKEENTIIVRVNVRTTPSNCGITNSCLLMQWCMMALQTRLGLSVPVMYGILFAGEGCRDCVGDRVVRVVGVGAYGACSDSAKWCVTLTWWQSWLMVLVSPAGPVPRPPVPSAPAPHYPGASGQVPQLLFSLPSN